MASAATPLRLAAGLADLQSSLRSVGPAPSAAALAELTDRLVAVTALIEAAAPGTPSACGSSPPDVTSLLGVVSRGGEAAEVEAAAKALAGLSREAGARAEMLEAGAVRSLVAALLLPVDEQPAAGPTRHVLACLQNLALQPDHGIADAPGLLPRLAQLLASPAAGVAAAAAGCASNLAGSGAAGCEALMREGFAPPLVRLLASPSAAAAEAAAAALGKLAWEPQHCGKLAEAGCLPGLVALLAAEHPEPLRELAAAALQNLTFESASIRRALAEPELGAVPLLVHLLHGHSGSQRCAARVLANLALSPANAAPIAAAGAVEPLVELMDHSDNAAVMAAAGAAVGKLAAAEPIARVMIAEARAHSSDSN